jgi:hypothetical protein
MSGVATFLQNLTASRSAATLQNTYTTAKQVINPTDIVPMPAVYLFPGAQFHISSFGAISNVVTAQPTFTFQVMVGAVIVWTSGALTSVAGANVLAPYRFELDLRLDTEGNGTAAKFIGVGWIQCAALGTGPLILPSTAPAVGTGFDSTAAGSMDFWVGLSASSASTGIRVDNYRVDQYRFGS